MVAGMANVIASMEELFRTHWPTSASVYLQEGVPAPGGRLRNRDLALTYKRLLREAKAVGDGREQQIDAALAAFYSGFVAEAIEIHCRTKSMHSSGTPHAGLLTGHDLASYRAGHEAAVSADFEAWTVAKCAAWSPGPVFLQQLRLLEGFDLARTGFLSAGHIPTVIECAKPAFPARQARHAHPALAE